MSQWFSCAAYSSRSPPQRKDAMFFLWSVQSWAIQSHDPTGLLTHYVTMHVTNLYRLQSFGNYITYIHVSNMYMQTCYTSKNPFCLIFHAIPSDSCFSQSVSGDFETVSSLETRNKSGVGCFVRSEQAPIFLYSSTYRMIAERTL